MCTPSSLLVQLAILGSSFLLARAEWAVSNPFDQRQPQPPGSWTPATTIQPGDAWPNDDRFRWLRGQLEIPNEIQGKPAAGQCVGLQFNCGDGGEFWFHGQLQCRYDNDHPALVLLATNALPGAPVELFAQVYAKVQGGDRFSDANWVLIDPQRALQPLPLQVHPNRPLGSVPSGLIGLSQGGGLADYQEETALKLKQGGFKWFRMDNVFTQILKPNTNGTLDYDWTDLDRRVDFLAAIGADAILAVSYMPQVLDAVPNNDRQSAPRDYALWEELCFQAARRCLDRGRRVAFWEVWNEVNTGWLKPGPSDTGSDAFKNLYSQALGREATDHEVVRRFEAYCKLYRATALGVRRADPKAKVGGPALASGPFEHDERGHCFHGRGFARGLMLWCQQEKLPLHFLSWHEYFHPAHVFAEEAQEFRAALNLFPDLKESVESLMITEWNEAWWADRPQDHEIGAAWAADCLTRAFIPHRVDRPCFFYVKQGDDRFRGDYSLLMKDNRPKAAYNVAKIFNHLRGRWAQVEGGDDEVSAVAAVDLEAPRLAVVLVNFNYRYGLARKVTLAIPHLPATLQKGVWREWTVDATHANAWHDWNRAELEMVDQGPVQETTLLQTKTLAPNSVTLLEVIP